MKEKVEGRAPRDSGRAVGTRHQPHMLLGLKQMPPSLTQFSYR